MHSGELTGCPQSGSWYVSNGETVVGPVPTELLIRGIASARIPGDCMVMQERWTAWRPVDQIRELSVLDRPFAWLEAIPDDVVRDAPDAGEALLLAMQAAVTATHASSGLVHRRREPFVGLVTSSVLGSGLEEQLGQVIPHHDPMLAEAVRGEVVLGGAESLALRAAAGRFAGAGESRGLAMVPVFDGGHLLAMIELARSDHPFRAEDSIVLRKLAQLVAAR
jgi:hypothetical protein